VVPNCEGAFCFPKKIEGHVKSAPALGEGFRWAAPELVLDALLSVEIPVQSNDKST
jgi:hypothetical protein